MALGKSNVAIDIQIKNVQKIVELKNSLKALRKQSKLIEKDTKENTKAGKYAAQQYQKNAKSIDRKSKALRELNRNQKDVTKSSGGMAKSFVKGAAAIGIIVGAFRLIGRTIGSFISTFTEFEFVMAKVHAVSGATSEEFKKLTASAEELGRTTFYTATQVGELQLAYSKLGFTAREIDQASEATINLATATGSDLLRASQVAGATIRGFGLDANETGRVVDVMAVSFASSAMDIEKWSTSMTKVAPIAQSAGFSIEDTAAIMSKLTDAGIEASIAGTSLRNILLKMQDPTSALTKSFGGTIHSLDQLVPAMEKFVIEGGSMADVMEVVDIRQAAAFETMLMSSDSILQYRDSLNSATGEGGRMAAMVGNTLQGSFLRVKSAIQGVSISIMKNFSGALQDNMIRLSNWLNMLAENPKRLKDTIYWIKMAVRAILSIVVGMKAMKIVTVANIALQKAFTFAVGQSAVALTLAQKATIAFSVSMRAVKAAIISTGLGVFIVLLGELAAQFMMAEDEEDKLSRATNEYGQVISELADYKQAMKDIDEAGNEVTADRIGLVENMIKKYGDLNTTDEEREGILRTLYKLDNDHFADLLVGETNQDLLTAAKERYRLELEKAEKDKESVKKHKEALAAKLTLEAQYNSQKAKRDEQSDKVLYKRQMLSSRRFDQLFSKRADKRFINTHVAYMEGHQALMNQAAAKIKENQKILDATLEAFEGRFDKETELDNEQRKLENFEKIMQQKILNIKRLREEGQTGGEWAKEEARLTAEATKSNTWQMYKDLKDGERSGEKGLGMLIKIKDIELQLEKMHLEDIRELNLQASTELISDLTDDLIEREEVRGRAGEERVITDMGVRDELLEIKKQEIEDAYALMSEAEKLSSKGLKNREKFKKNELQVQKNFNADIKSEDAADYNEEKHMLNLALANRLSSKSEHDIAMLDLYDKHIIDKLALVRGDIKAETKLLEEQDKNNLKRVKITNKEKLDIQSDANTTANLNLQLERATSEMSDIEFQQRKLDLEGDALAKKAILYKDDADMMRDIKNEQLEHDIKVFESQKDMREKSISAMGGVGSALTSLAGDNEKLNAVKEIGNTISMVANTLSTIATLKANMETLSKIKQNATDAAGNIISATDNVQTGTGIVLKGADSAANLISAGSKNVDTASTIGNTIATTLSIIPKALSAILASAGAIPFPLNLIAIAATYKILKKVMKFEEGGVVEGKYANGGMVHGPSHANGGVKFAVGGRVNELEGGEAVINKRSTAMFRNQLSSMNQAGGGVKFADGGLMSSPAFAESQFNANNQNQMIGAMNGQRKVVVVESDITTSQSTVSVIQANASF